MSAAAALPFAFGVFALMALRALANGAGVEDVLAYGVFLAAYVVLPGWLVYRLLRAPDDDWLMALGMGWMLGHVIQLGSYLALKWASASWLYWYFPVLLLPLAAAALRSRSFRTAGAQARTGHVVLLLGIVALAIQRTLLVPYWFLAGDPDFVFHVGNAAELKHHWPLTDPRLAGEIFNYHFFSYAFPAGASQVTGIPVFALMQRLSATALPALLALQTFNAARAYGRSAAAGLLGAALLVLHSDTAVTLLPLLGLGRFSSGFHAQQLELGLYTGSTTVFGLALFVTLAIVLRRWLTGTRADPRALGLAAALAFAASGAKGSVMPVVLAALGGLTVWTWLRPARPARALVATLVLTAAAAPMTLQLAFGQGSFVSAMLRIGPLQGLFTSGFYQEIASLLDVPDLWLAPVLAPVWLLGFLGLGGVTGLLFLLRERRRLDDAQRWLAFTFVAGLVPALVLKGPNWDQLHFLYAGEVALALLGGTWLASQGRPRTRRGLVLALALLGLALPTLAGVGLELAARLERDWAFRPRARALRADYAAGLGWIRNATSSNDLFVTQHGFFLLSAFGERRVFYESDWYSARGHASRSPGERYGSRTLKRDPDPYAPRQRAFLRFLSGPDREAVRRLRAFAPGAGAIHLVVDSVTLRIGRIGREGGVYSIRARPRPDPYETNPLLTPVFSNRALRIYRVAASPRSAAPEVDARRPVYAGRPEASGAGKAREDAARRVGSTLGWRSSPRSRRAPRPAATRRALSQRAVRTCRTPPRGRPPRSQAERRLPASRQRPIDPDSEGGVQGEE